MKARFLVAKCLAGCMVLAFVGWAVAFVWQVTELRSCGERACPPSSTEKPIRLPSGVVLPVISASLLEDGHLMFEYQTAQDRRHYGDLCREAELVWAGIRDTDRVAGASVVNLGPTSAASEYLGLGAYLLPAYRCCVSTYITVRKNGGGEWQFRKPCPRE